MTYRKTPAVQARRHECRFGILLAAQECVAEKGFSGTRMTGIARRAKVATGTLYNHFPSREALFTEVFRRVADHELKLAGIAVAGRGPVDARLEKSLGEWCRRAIKSGRLAYALLIEPVERGVAMERAAFKGAYTSLYTELIEEGIAAGEFPPQDSAVTAAGLIGALAEILVTPLAAGGAKEIRDREALIDDILGFCMSGIRQQRIAETRPMQRAMR